MCGYPLMVRVVKQQAVHAHDSAVMLAGCPIVDRNMTQAHVDGLTAVLALPQPKGGSFTGDEKDFLRFKLGDHSVIPAFEEAVASMKVRLSWVHGRSQPVMQQTCSS